MRVTNGLAAAMCLAATVTCGFHSAFADTEADGAEEAAIERYLLFAGVDLWRAGGFVHGGLLWSPGGVQREGFTFKVLTGGGVYRYQSGRGEIKGNSGLVSAMPGWRFKTDGLEITAVAGVDLQMHRLRPDDPGNAMRGTHIGVRGGFDLWYEPSAWMMVAASASVSSIGPDYWTRIATGWRVFDRVWVGPEALALGGSNYQNWRVGLHATSFKTGPLEWSAGLGYVRDSDHRNGVYGRIGILNRR